MVKLMSLSDIKIPKCFAENPPKKEKLYACRQFFDAFGYLDRSIVVNGNDTLVDGYVGYLVLKENRVERYDAVIDNCQDKRSHSTDIILLGKHKPDGKEYSWRVTRGKRGTRGIQYAKVGSRMIVNTSRGQKVVRITRITNDKEYGLENLPTNTVVKCLKS